jgi:hypothetical protein
MSHEPLGQVIAVETWQQRTTIGISKVWNANPEFLYVWTSLLVLLCKMLVVIYTVKVVYSFVCRKCSTSCCIGDALMNPLNLWCIILLSHNGYPMFCVATGLKRHDVYLLHCCLIRLYVVLNPERFVLHVCHSFYCLIWQTQLKKFTFNVARTHAHAHTFVPVRFAERLVYSIPGRCNMTQNFIPLRLISFQWAAW